MSKNSVGQNLTSYTDPTFDPTQKAVIDENQGISYNSGMDTPITERQKRFLSEDRLARINLLEGSVRSGKTWISLVAWAIFVASMPRDAEFLMVGKTLTTLKRNCLGLLQQLEPSFKYTTTSKRAFLYGRTVWLEGADNEASENKIRGMTLAGAYFDELTLIPEGFYYMTLSRLSYKGARLFATTNPDSPVHYVYTDIIENENIDKQVSKFLIRDNTFLEPEYVEELEKEYEAVPTSYQRYILGEWVLAEGLVYPNYSNTVPTTERAYSRYIVSMDYGIQNPTAMLLWGLNEGVWYAIREYYHSGRDTNDQKTDEQYYQELCKLCDDLPVERIIIDPSASSFITLVRQKGKYMVRHANNDVLDGIHHVGSALTNRMILFNDCCKNTIREFSLYSWNPKAVTDAVIKENDHAMDAVRYFVQTNRVYRTLEQYKSPFMG